jgi:hypothetical protein
MNETLACSECGRSLHVPDELRGQAVKCPACHYTFTAPGIGSEVASAPAFAPPQQDSLPQEGAPSRRPVLYPEANVFDNLPRGRDPDQRYSIDETRQGGYPKPGKVQAIAVMTMIGGILALLWGLSFAASCVMLAWPGTYYSFVLGIMAIVRASALLGDGARGQNPQAIAIMQIINVMNVDLINMTLGIITLCFLNEPEVKAYFRR